MSISKRKSYIRALLPKELVDAAKRYAQSDARTLANRTGVILCDVITAKLDAESQGRHSKNITISNKK